jgi:hypothetical protein
MGLLDAEPVMDSKRRPLSAEEEAGFHQWLRTNPDVARWRAAFMARFGEAPNYNDPLYDYRTAYRYGVTPQPYAPDGGFPHWGSEVVAPPFAQPIPLKQPDHPTEWMQKFMDQYGVDPNLAPVSMLIDASRRGIFPPLTNFLAHPPEVDMFDVYGR